MKTTKRVKIAAAAVAALGIVVTATACTSDTNDSAQQASQGTSETLSQTAQKAVPYPLSQMQAGGFLERTELKEHLLRQNDKNALRYIVLLTQQGQVIAQYPIQGMVFDPNSQLTNTQNIETGYTNQAAYSDVVDSPGDNGTWGPEAGNAAFFTTSGVEIQVPTGLLWVESDAPLDIKSTPIINYNANEAPSTNHGGVPVGGH
jgi:hypothetical protein